MLEDESAALEYFGKVNIGGTVMLEVLRFYLESNDILE